MAQHTIKIANPALEDELTTYLRSDVSASATNLPVTSTTGFVTSGTDDYFVLVGKYGDEKSEIREVDASDAETDNDSFKVDTCLFSHETSDPVTYMRYNKIRIYGATTLTGAKTAITTITIDPTNHFTPYTYTGTTYSYFFVTYINDAGTEVETSYSDAITTTSFSRNSVKRIINSALRKAHTTIDQNEDGIITWETAIEIVADGIDEILTRKRRWNFLHKRDSSTSTTINQAYITKLSDINALDFLIVNSIKLDYITPYKYNQYTQSGTTSTTGQPYEYTEKGDSYYLYPTPDSVYTVICEYWKQYSNLDLSTEIDYPLVTMLIHYTAAHIAWVRGNDKVGQREYALFSKILEQQVEEYSGPNQYGDAESIEFTSEINEDNFGEI